MSKTLCVTPQGYYHYLKTLEKPYKYELLLAEMRKIISEDECNDKYGSVRMHQALVYKNYIYNHNFPDIPSERTIYRIMSEHALIHLSNHKPNGLTKADKLAQKADDLLNRDFYSDKPLEKAVTDMTELPTANGKLYISGVFDCFDLVPIGFSMADNMRAEICATTSTNIITKLSTTEPERRFTVNVLLKMSKIKYYYSAND